MYCACVYVLAHLHATSFLEKPGNAEWQTNKGQQKGEIAGKKFLWRKPFFLTTSGSQAELSIVNLWTRTKYDLNKVIPDKTHEKYQANNQSPVIHAHFSPHSLGLLQNDHHFYDAWHY